MTDDFAPFSATARARHWAALSSREWDLLVVGGGITGAAAARDAAGRGLSVALVEAGDFAQGTSSRSSRLVHGGLRYLETYDFALVFEASAERRRLLELAPHLVHPLPFVFPVYRGGPTPFLMLRRQPADVIGPLEQSALMEMGNIVCAAYVGVLGTFLSKSVMIGTPELHEGERHALAHHVTGLMIETDFSFLDTTFEGVFVLSHTDVSFTSLLRALGFTDVATA